MLHTNVFGEFYNTLIGSDDILTQKQLLDGDLGLDPFGKLVDGVNLPHSVF